MAKTIKQLVEQFNIKVKTDFIKEYQGFNPVLKSMFWEFMSGKTHQTTFPLLNFLQDLEKLNGKGITYQSPADSFQFTVQNEEYGKGVSIPFVDFDRAAANENLMALNPYQNQIDNMVAAAREYPLKQGIQYIEAGAGNTLGTTFDQQNLYDTTHNWGDVAGTQDNIVTGSGADTIAKIHADLLTVLSRFHGFYYPVTADGSNEDTRQLNQDMMISDMVVLIPHQLVGLFTKLSSLDMIASTTTSSETNLFKGLKFVSRKLADANDYYCFNIKEIAKGFAPVLISNEYPLEIRTPKPTDDAYKSGNELRYGLYRRHGLGYGAWWSTIKVTNT
jgi:hypothetical protein